MDIRSKKTQVALVVAAFVIFAVAATAYYATRRKGAEDGGTVRQEVPPAEQTDPPETKTEGYRGAARSEIYWNDLEALEAGDPEADSSEAIPRAERHAPGEINVEDLFGDCRDASAPPLQERAPAPRTSSGGGGGGGGSARRQPSQGQAEPRPSQGGQTEQAAPAAEAPAADPPAPVKRTGAISSLDEDVFGELGSGFSTLDGSDRWVSGGPDRPYRCMFMRDEKVRTGQRVTVRLLEDLVVGSVHIPQNTHLQGVCTIADRMELSFTSIDLGGRILSLRFQAYDTDGGRGIYCSDISKGVQEATGQGLSTVTTTLNSRLGRVARDAAAVGASVVRSKTGEATVSVPAGYTFYIIEEKR